MKAKLFTAIISTSLLLSACGGHNNPKAVDKLEEAEANAKANAPKAEEVKFDDHGQPTMGGVGGASDASVAPATDVAETTTATPETTETAKPASTKMAETMAVAEAPAPAETATAKETAPADTKTKQ